MNSIKSIAGTAHPVVLGMCLPVVLFSNDTIKSGQLIYKNNLLMASVQDRHKQKITLAQPKLSQKRFSLTIFYATKILALLFLICLDLHFICFLFLLSIIQYKI